MPMAARYTGTDYKNNNVCLYGGKTIYNAIITLYIVAAKQAHRFRKNSVRNIKRCKPPSAHLPHQRNGVAGCVGNQPVLHGLAERLTAGIVRGIHRRDPDDDFLIGFLLLRKGHRGRGRVITGRHAALGEEIIHIAIHRAEIAEPVRGQIGVSQKVLRRMV